MLGCSHRQSKRPYQFYTLALSVTIASFPSWSSQQTASLGCDARGVIDSPAVQQARTCANTLVISDSQFMLHCTGREHSASWCRISDASIPGLDGASGAIIIATVVLAGDDHGELTQLVHLQQDMIVSILELTGDPRSILNARLASSLLRDAASLAIDTVVAPNGYMPVTACSFLARACKVVVRVTGAPSAPTFLHNMLQLLSELPERVISIDSSCVWPLLSPEDSMQLVQQLVASACHDSLTDLTLYQLSSTAAADVILQRLPNLQHVSFDNLMKAPAGSLPAHDSSWCPLADLSNMAGLGHAGAGNVRAAPGDSQCERSVRPGM